MPVARFNELFAVLWMGDENVGGEDGNEAESILMHSVNGRMVCALPAFETGAPLSRSSG